MYNSYFSCQIRDRGFEYYKSGKVTDIVKNGNKVNAVVTGTKPYYVEVVFNESDDRIIEYAKCSCPHFSDSGIYCKHIYATIISLKYSEEREKQENLEEEKAIENIKAECEKYIIMCKKALRKIENQLKFNGRHLTEKSYNDYAEEYAGYLRNFNSNVELAHKNSQYMLFYQTRLDSLKRIYEKLSNA